MEDNMSKVENGFGPSLSFKCKVHAATPCIEDSRFLRDSEGDLMHPKGTVNGRVSRKYRHVKKDGILSWVGFESRHQFIAMNKETVEQNERDRQMLIRLLRAMDINGEKLDIQGDEPLHVLAKTYNYYDPRLAHIHIKSMDASKQIPIIGTKPADPETPGNTQADEYERQSLLEWHAENNPDKKVHPQTGLVKLRQWKVEREAEIEKERDK